MTDELLKTEDKHQDLTDAGQYTHAELDDYMERLVAKGTRTVQIAETTVLTLTNQSDVSATELDLSSYVTPRTFIVHLRLSMQDSGSAAGQTYIAVRKNGAAAPSDLVCEGHQVNDIIGYESGPVRCDSDQKVQYAIDASGAGTANVTIVLFGYEEGIWNYQQEE